MGLDRREGSAAPVIIAAINSRTSAFPSPPTPSPSSAGRGGAEVSPGIIALATAMGRLVLSFPPPFLPLTAHPCPVLRSFHPCLSPRLDLTHSSATPLLQVRSQLSHVLHPYLLCPSFQLLCSPTRVPRCFSPSQLPHTYSAPIKALILPPPILLT